MDRDALLRRQMELLGQEAVILTMMAALGMPLPPRGDRAKQIATKPAAQAPTAHTCNCTNHMNERRW